MTDRKDSLWKTIATAISADIAQGRYTTGDKLPTETELSRRFGVNRHTVRRALGDLAAAGAVHARRGAGVFVAATPLDYAIGRRVRFSQNLAANGRVASGITSRAETLIAAPHEAQALGLAAGELVHVVEGISLADATAIAMSRSIFPAQRLPGLLAALAEQPSITAALAACGIHDYTRASTRLNAVTATALQATTLRIATGAALLRSESVNIDSAGRPIEFGTTWFAGDRVTLTVQPD